MKHSESMQLNMIGIITSQFDTMLAFYRDVMGMEVALQMESYAEFRHEGIRFAICTHAVMVQATGHKSFSEQRAGQSFELAFAVVSPEAVDTAYDDIVQKGAVPIKAPENLPWNQRAAFFADPDGNVHEIFADLPNQS